MLDSLATECQEPPFRPSFLIKQSNTFFAELAVPSAARTHLSIVSTKYTTSTNFDFGTSASLDTFPSSIAVFWYWVSKNLEYALAREEWFLKPTLKKDSYTVIVHRDCQRTFE
jgi:hypothetical protein